MKIINFFLKALSILVIGFLLQSCSKAEDEFIHTTNTISQMVCKASHTSGEFLGTIHEYNADGQLMSGSFTKEEIEGGYGVILFAIPKSLEKDVDLTNVYLVATVTYDEFITPSLSGRHDISGDGIIIQVKSGVGTTREYRVRGYYE